MFFFYKYRYIVNVNSRNPQKGQWKTRAYFQTGIHLAVLDAQYSTFWIHFMQSLHCYKIYHNSRQYHQIELSLSLFQATVFNRNKQKIHNVGYFHGFRAKRPFLFIKIVKRED